MADDLVSGASVPDDHQDEILEALNEVADLRGVDPAAIAGIIHMESVWKTRCVTGRYIGLTQVGPDFVEFLGLTKAQFLRLSAARQIRHYGDWLGYYRFTQQMARHNIDVLAQPLARQAALLQAMQFAPNGQAWKIAFARGDFSVKSTESDQADALGDTSIGDMEEYYEGFFERNPPEYA